MQIDHPQTNCKHASCQCVIEADQEYCSDACRRANENAGTVGQEMQEGCPCAHPECDQP